MEKDKGMSKGNYFTLSRKGTDCPYKPITCQEGFCGDCQIYLDYLETLKGKVSTPEWLKKQEEGK